MAAPRTKTGSQEALRGAGTNLCMSGIFLEHIFKYQNDDSDECGGAI